MEAFLFTEKSSHKTIPLSLQEGVYTNYTLSNKNKAGYLLISDN